MYCKNHICSERFFFFRSTDNEPCIRQHNFSVKYSYLQIDNNLRAVPERFIGISFYLNAPSRTEVPSIDLLLIEPGPHVDLLFNSATYYERRVATLYSIRTATGFLTHRHFTCPWMGPGSYRAVLFNPKT